MPGHDDATATGPMVSVIIPAYNCERYIDQTIGSVLGQSFHDLEVVVVDDGSRDSTPDLAAAFGSPVRLVTQANAGVCVARNRGIREANGRFVCLMDHDDYWFPDKLARQLAAMRAHPECGVVYAPFIVWHRDAAGRFPAPERFDAARCPDGIDGEFSGWIYHQFLLDCWMLTSTAMFRREVFDRCGSFDEALPYSEDWDLWLRIAREYPFIKLTRPNTLYRQHVAQGSRVMRDVDYRTVLLTKAVKAWGFCSRDGRCVRPEVFFRRLADYYAEYALDQLRDGRRRAALAGLTNAWVTRPVKVKFLAYMVAALLGWRPTW
jgi:glycosyltransferase involved in cell wall biosynthesis